MENGVFPTLPVAYDNDPDENFEMVEPQPLGLNNVMFCFISLGFLKSSEHSKLKLFFSTTHSNIEQLIVKKKDC